MRTAVSGGGDFGAQLFLELFFHHNYLINMYLIIIFNYILKLFDKYVIIIFSYLL